MPATLSAGAFIAAILVLIPSPAHWRARNVAILSLIAWLVVVDLIYGVNTIVWSGNVEVRLVVWCDITTKIIIGASSALPAAAMCICKHLELVASGRAVRLTREDQRRRMCFEFAMCFGAPVVLMALHYIVQGHRFDIVEDIGCQAATYYSIPAVFIVWFPPLLFATITFIYAGLALNHFFRQRLNFATHLRSCDSALTTSRYLRLIAISITEMLWGASLTALAMYDNIAPGLYPYTSWASVHSSFSRIGQYTLVEFSPRARGQAFLFVWAVPASSFIFFVFFGFGEEAVKDYRRALSWVARKVVRLPAKHDKTKLPLLPMGRPSLSTTKFSSSFRPSSSFDFSDGKALPAYYAPRDASLDIEDYVRPSRSPRSPSFPAKAEVGAYPAHRASIMLSDAELDALLARCPSIRSSVPSPGSPTELGHRIEVADAHPAERPVSTHAAHSSPIAAPSPAYHYRSPSSPGGHSHRAQASAAAPCPVNLNVGQVLLLVNTERAA
ncbi:pheromone A receptor-domain-containing protein [Fomitopsis serialis]|uniref:pheromone A receptor-domain-containing protein n=1 Tax=Fomitopsis serialis TaxID=139415 RepID=UPI002008034E|nr:pheromone A receptor-domain-containing protein [Neoantrodia serialis]KAH9919596.1 pheromone A receptor-domain-containing protein [Neoantrodia serialis]